MKKILLKSFYINFQYDLLVCIALLYHIFYILIDLETTIGTQQQKKEKEKRKPQ